MTPLNGETQYRITTKKGETTFNLNRKRIEIAYEQRKMSPFSCRQGLTNEMVSVLYTIDLKGYGSR